MDKTQDDKLSEALAELVRIERERSTNPSQRRFYDFVERVNALAESRLPMGDEPADDDDLRLFYETVRFCDEYKFPLPTWARAASKDPIALAELLTARKPGAKKGGRHSRSLTERAERLRKRYYAAAVKLATIEGKKGDDKLRAARDMVEAVGFKFRGDSKDDNRGLSTMQQVQGKPVSSLWVLHLKKLLLRGESVT